MKKKQKLFLGFAVLIITAIITMAGCASLTEAFAEASKEKTFPEGFIGTWERGYKSKYTSTLTITSNTIQASNQSYYWILRSYASKQKGIYIIEASNDPTRGTSSFAKSAYRITINLTNEGNLDIIDEEDYSQTSSLIIHNSPDGKWAETESKVLTEDEWTGIWKRKQ
jgi:hypothetical protein